MAIIDGEDKIKALKGELKLEDICNELHGNEMWEREQELSKGDYENSDSYFEYEEEDGESNEED